LIDNVAVYEPVAGTDVTVSFIDAGKLDPTPAFVGFTKYLTGLPLSIRIVVANAGTEVITSFDLSWSDGTNTYSQSVTGVNIPPLETYELTATQQYIIKGLYITPKDFSDWNKAVAAVSPEYKEQVVLKKK